MDGLLTTGPLGGRIFRGRASFFICGPVCAWFYVRRGGDVDDGSFSDGRFSVSATVVQLQLSRLFTNEAAYNL